MGNLRVSGQLVIDDNFLLQPKYDLFLMEDGASIVARKDLVIHARRAEFGDNCTIIASGEAGAGGHDAFAQPAAAGVNGAPGGDGRPGGNGRNVTITAGLAKGGQVSIVTDGGAGGRGGRGQAGGTFSAEHRRAGDGGLGGNGGNGGDAGQISVTWISLSANQPSDAAFPAGHRYSSSGGAGGSSGMGGAPGQRGGLMGTYGQPGAAGAQGRAGVSRDVLIQSKRRAALQWVQKQNMGPAARVDHAMAWHPDRRRLTLFGGARADQAVDDTWEWDGHLWMQVADTGPSGRRGHAMAFDLATGAVLLFGGSGAAQGPAAGAMLGDTWLWDGQDWIQAADTGPSPRRLFALAADPVRKTVVLFGGETTDAGGADPALVGDTWVWDGSEWTQREDVGPSPRRGARMAWDPITEMIVLFGGEGGDRGQDGGYGTRPGDTWGWNGETWKQLADMGPAGRAGHDMATDGFGVILFGGVSDTSRGDTWAFYDQRWRQIQDIGPSRRSGHAMTFDDHDERIVLFGGLTGGIGAHAGHQQGDTWYLMERRLPGA